MKFKIIVHRDKCNVLTKYQKKNRIFAASQNDPQVTIQNDRLVEFEHDCANCAWILCTNNLSFFEKQLKHLDVFINATIYQMPYKVFDYIHNAEHLWMMDDKNDERLAQNLSMLTDVNCKLNESQQSAIAKSLIYPISLIQGPPGTGKTYTLSYLCHVIMANQLKESHEIIVITAHSHAACDQILETLTKNNDLFGMDLQRITRFGAISKIGKSLRKYAFRIMLQHKDEYKEYLKFQHANFPDKARECLYKLARNILMDEIDIVITTCYGCSNLLLMNIDVPVSHLIIDEATQIVESELLIAFNLLRDKRSQQKATTLQQQNSANYYSPMPPYNDSLKPFTKDARVFDIDLDDFQKRIVMIGDPKQLCPVVQSADAIEHGYSISMFERLLGLHSIKSIRDEIRKIEQTKRKQEMSNIDGNYINHVTTSGFGGFNKASHALQFSAVYKEKEAKMQELISEQQQQQQLGNALHHQLQSPSKGDVALINYTLLNVQYRMKEFMMRFCNEQFYDNAIQTGMPAEQEQIINGFDWRDPHKSVMFVSLQNSMQTKIASTYFNLDECEYIDRIISEIILSNRTEISGKDIGIIAMHRAQVVQMKKVLSRNQRVNTRDIEVNTVDGFQGKEKKLIILSFVRTDGTSTSFLANPQRCNVALTRAKYGLIVCGQLQQLQANRMWSKFAKFAQHHDIITALQ